LDHVNSRAIDLIEAAYDLDKPDSDWLPDLIQTHASLLDQGHGIVGFEFARHPGDGGGDATVHQMHTSSLAPDFPQRFEQARGVISPECFRAVTPAGYAGTWTELSKDYPEESRRFLETLGYRDLLVITAVDPNGAGVQFISPLSDATILKPRARERWKMLGAHIATAFRLRRGLAEAGSATSSGSVPGGTGLPYHAEVMLDPDGVHILEAVGHATEPSAADALREAARNVDQARGALRRADPQLALETWKALVSGRWSMVDWFDTDGRRYILGVPNPPELGDPRGLTDQESQVVTYVLLGETSKLIAYRLGLSAARISGLLKSAMHKLGVDNKLDLVRKLRPFERH
jgi:DNA-binding CsgD family transcriptional regulator